jgi:hypothetical protein
MDHPPSFPIVGAVVVKARKTSLQKFREDGILVGFLFQFGQGLPGLFLGDTVLLQIEQ